jgi:hypothetical protein
MVKAENVEDIKIGEDTLVLRIVRFIKVSHCVRSELSKE